MHHLLSIIQASLKAAWLRARRLSPTLEGENSDIFESAIEFSKGILRISPEQWCEAIQWAVQQAFEPAIDFKKSRKACISSLHHEWPAVEFTQAFLAGCTSYHGRYDIDIYTQRTTKLFTPIIKSFVALKVLIQNERTRWFTVRTLRSAFVQGIVRDRYSPIFFYYELLVSQCLTPCYIHVTSRVFTYPNWFRLQFHTSSDMKNTECLKPY